MNVGDARTWLTSELWKSLEKVVNQKAGYKYLYYIQVQFHPNYNGPAAANHDKAKVDRDVKAQKVFSTRLVLMNNPPAVPQLGTMLFKVDNRSGRGDVYHMYTLPRDKPNTMQDSDNAGEVVSSVAENARGMNIPLLFN